MLRINSVDMWLAVRGGIVSEQVQSSTHGPLLVPCMTTFLVARALVQANTYNPNSVSDDKMDLLKQSILDNGFCFPVVTIWDEDLQRFVIIDGFHRATIMGPGWLDCDYLPIVVLQHDITQRMAATVQFNKARGVHQVDLDADVVRALLEQGLTEEQISERLGMDVESVHRYKQITGIAELFRNAEYSLAWEMMEDDKP